MKLPKVGAYEDPSSAVLWPASQYDQPAADQEPEAECAADLEETQQPLQESQEQDVDDDDEPDWMKAAKCWVKERKDTPSDEPWKEETKVWLEARKSGQNPALGSFPSPVVPAVTDKEPKSLLWCCYPKNSDEMLRERILACTG